MRQLGVFLFLLSACQSDAEKLGMLRSDRAIECLLTGDSAVHRLSERVAKGGKPSKAVLDSVRYAQRIKCELAERALNLFMEGR